MDAMSEFVVLEGSPLVGRTLGDVADNYGVNVLHFHNSASGEMARMPYSPDQRIGDGFLVKVSGLLDDVSALRLESVNYS